MMIFVHFGFETHQSWYFVHSGKGAMYLSRASLAICLIEALLVLVIPDTMAVILSIEFITADTFSAFTSMSLLFNKAMPTEMRVLAFSVLLHTIGVSLKLYLLPIELYVHNITPLFGAPWVFIGLAAVPQIWLCQDVIRGGINHIGPDQADYGRNFVYIL